MDLSKDWREFLELPNSRGVDYVIVGAHNKSLNRPSRHPERSEESYQACWLRLHSRTSCDWDTL